MSFPVALRLILCLFSLVGSVHAFEGSCAHLVGKDYVAASFRQELLDAALRYTDRFPENNASRSNLARVSNPEVDKAWDAFATLDDDVVSLGSGPDVMRPLYDFPFAKHIHLVDVLEGWGNEQNAGVTFRELERRLHHIGPNARVSVVREGFLKERSREELFTRGIYRSKLARPDSDLFEVDTFDEPCTWKVEWDSPSAGAQVRYFSLHLYDYNVEILVEEVLKDLPSKKFGGLLITGAFPPQPHAFNLFLEQMKAEGLMIVEMDYFRIDDFEDFETDHMIRELIYRAGFYKESMAERSPILMALKPDLYWPNAYLFRKM